MTRLPTPLHRPYRAASRTYTPQSVGDLALWYPIDGRVWQDSARTSPAGVGDPVGARDDYSGNARHALQATTLKKPTFSATGPGIQYDGVDDLMTTTYALSPASQFAIMMAIWGKDGSDSFKTVALQPLKANLAGEYAIQIEDGDVFSFAMPSNWLANQWEISGWVVPDYSGTNGSFRIIASFRLDSSNIIRFGQHSDGSLYATVIVAGDGTKVVELSPPFAAGVPLFFGVRLGGGTLTLYADSNGDGTLETTSVGSVAAFATSSGWSGFIGTDGNAPGAANFPGAVNLVVNDGVGPAPITDRFGGGAGQAFATWLQAYHLNIVLHVGGNGDGSRAQLDTDAGFSQLITNTGFETNASGWSGTAATLSQSAAQAKAGTKSLLVDATGNAASVVPTGGLGVTLDRWLIAKASIYPTVSSASFRNNGAGIPAFSFTATSLGAWNDGVRAVRASATGTVNVIEFHTGGADQDDFYVDEVYVYQLGVITPSVATKGVPTRVIVSATKAGSLGPYVFVGITGTEKVRIGYRNDAGAIAQADSSGSVTIAPHSLSLEFDGTTLRAYVDTVLVVSLALAGTFTGLDTLGLGGMKTTAEGHSFDERIGDAWLSPGRVYSAIERKRLHNDHLVPRTTGLAAA